MTPMPYVFFNGNCRDALTFYGEVFGTQPEMMEATGIPEEFPIPEDKKTWIMHGQVPIGAGALMASDNLFGESAKMSGCAVNLSYPTAEEAKGIFDKLAAGGEITMAWEPTFWSAGFGTLVDKFGVHWMVGCDEGMPD